MLKIFIVKVILHMLNFWGVEHSFSYVTKLNKINTVKSQKIFNFRFYHIMYNDSS